MRVARLVTSMTLLAACLCCAGRQPKPAPLDTKTDICRSCRMPVSDPRLASQLVADGEEPLFFDDLGCLRDYLIAHPAVRGTAAYVADHRSAAWVPAERAVFARCAGIETPMGSHLVAHVDAASREADPGAKEGSTAVSQRDIFGPLGPPGTTP